MILVITLVAAAGAVALSVISLVFPPEINPLPNEYTPAAIMLINNASFVGRALASHCQQVKGMELSPYQQFDL
jgi:hypothetical protein